MLDAGLFKKLLEPVLAWDLKGLIDLAKLVDGFEEHC